MDDATTADVIRERRQAAGWSIAAAARELKRHATQPLPGVESIIRQWKRWEAGTEPGNLYRPVLGSLFRLDPVTLRPTGSAAGNGPVVPLYGDWWAAWQSSRDRDEVLAVQPVRLTQQGEVIDWRALRRGRPIEAGGYLWRGELRIWDNEILMGWYSAEDGSVRSKGTVYLVLHPQGQKMTGRWVGLSWDGDTVTGLGAMARTEEDVNQVIRGLIDKDR